MNASTVQPAIGFIGLGIMGAAMARRIAAAGYALHVYNRSFDKARPLVEAGAKWHATPAALAQACDIAITMVGTPADVRTIYFDAGGLIAHARNGSILIDMTTSSPELAEEIAREAAMRGLRALDAPVSGGDVGAREGRLSIMVGGDGDTVAQVEPLLRCMGTQVVRQGGPGAGQHAKLCNQIVIASTMIGVCEGLAYAASAGLDPQTVLASIGGGAAGGFLLNNLGPKIVKSDFAPGFFIEHFVKDMSIARGEAERLGRTLPGLELAYRLYSDLASAGHAREGTQALTRHYED
ncbi:NAD(P)-dependent oxidoreductase [Burkholderia cenocepacia]|uniref:NAD(P)-dependent oxidoreductase n=1 Tax=Burkholderia cenocepacia TaxID=95486 RepID=UPI001B9DAD38|nr:NAD(P)-dependent oxidoreductase [Burkholderia cenocepacia]MBR8093769.1 NAD(P)-dependent oxidoreductase [Burkholderia cenocepacia]UJH76188.1 NAD(P)-dependent oxidoreductase [Burkholderia cenocepacia]